MSFLKVVFLNYFSVFVAPKMTLRLNIYVRFSFRINIKKACEIFTGFFNYKLNNTYCWVSTNS